MSSAKFISKANPQAVYEVDQRDFLIGRSKKCALIINDPLVSRQHARVRVLHGNCYIENLGQNPTLVNGVSITRQFLQSGDHITIGGSDFIFQSDLKTNISSKVPPPQDETETIFAPSSTELPSVRQLIVNSSEGDHFIFPLDQNRFLIGRNPDCDIRLQSELISRHHAEIYFNGKKWCVKDLESRNGTFLGGSRINETFLHKNSTLQLGIGGPIIWLNFEGVTTESVTAAKSIQEITERYFSDSPTADAGEHTMMVRTAFQKVKKSHSKRYLGIIGGIAFFLVISIGIGIYQHIKLKHAKQLAIEIFYNMKTISLQIAKLEDMIRIIGASKRLETEAAEKKEQLTAMEEQYNQFIRDLNIISKDMSEEDKLIYRIARMFGECEINMPDEFVKEVKKYIKKWKSSTRLQNAIRRMQANNYAPTVAETLDSYDLPPQFLYLALQESDFFKNAVGPVTRYGIAKGIWQFIPETARDYGLRVGPLVDQRKYDPLDERFDIPAATEAAGRFLRDIYNSEAQASGLLVMASYNWGPTPIKKRIRAMPENPKERNFWKLLISHRIPKETYDYVFYIVSAAVIGENPRLFGFDFDNPLTPRGKE
jgi:pSer/pThr/pTyr-binding forkhead associated (FHA) protein